MTAKFSTLDPHSRGIAIATFGVVVLSFDAILVRLTVASGWDIVFWRGWLIFLALGAYLLIRYRPVSLPATRRQWLAAGVITVLYGVDTSLFVFSVSLTRVANTVVLLSCSPFFAAIFSWVFLGERVRLRTWMAIVAGMAGVLVVFSGSLELGTSLGDLLALLLAVFVGVTMTVLRSVPDLPRTPLVCGSGAVAGLLAWPLADPLSLSASSYGWLALMGLLQMPVASVLLMTATRYLPAPEVSLFLLIETVLGPLWVWLALGEEPPSLTLIGGAVILGAIAVHSWLQLRETRGNRRTAAALEAQRRENAGARE